MLKSKPKLNLREVTGVSTLAMKLSTIFQSKHRNMLNNHVKKLLETCPVSILKALNMDKKESWSPKRFVLL